jgi:hypothetical protein
MKVCTLVTTLVLTALTVNCAWGSDPNQTCLSAYPRFQKQFRDSSRMSQNMIRSLTPMIGLPADTNLSEVVAAIRDFGPEEVEVLRLISRRMDGAFLKKR